MIEFKNEVAVITGAGNGQGEAEAHLFAELGARVVVADIDEAAAIRVANDIGADRAIPLAIDISEEAGWNRLVASAVERFGAIDILVNNAAVFKPVPLLDAPMEDVLAMVRINLVGSYLGIRMVGRQMVVQGRGGSIVNVASVGALSPGEGSTVYGMTKGAVVTLTRGAAVELGPKIRINCVLPGGIDTQMLGAENRPFFDNIPLARTGQPMEIARAVAFLASSAASYCTGTSLVVDGGWLLGESAEKFTRLRDAATAEQAGGA